MQDTTTNLELPYIMPSQAQKHVTHNEALLILDAIVQLSIIDRDLTEPPGGMEEGDRYIVAAGATGLWAGQEGTIALFHDGEWRFVVPRAGFTAWLMDDAALIYWTGSAWESFVGAIAELRDLGRLGIGTTADAVNPFAAKLNKALWTARAAGEGGDGDLRYTMNKEAAGNVLSLLMQSGWSGRAEFGLVGNDDLSVKVSPDGSSWTTALSVDRATGLARVAGVPTEEFGIATKGYVDTRPASAIANTPAGGISATDVQAAIDHLDGTKMSRSGDSVSGTYTFGGTVNFNGILAISGQTPTYTRDGAAGLVRFINFRDTNASHVTLVADVARGTQAVPAFMTNTGLMFEVAVRPFDGSAVGLVTSGRFAFRASENHGATARGTALKVELVPNGSTAIQEVASFAADSGLSLFGANPVIDQNRHQRLRPYTVATLPSPSPAGQMIGVSDGSANRWLAVSDGSNWRFPDGSIVS